MLDVDQSERKSVESVPAPTSTARRTDGTSMGEVVANMPAGTAGRPLPQWFDAAKLGVMFSWGLYSVPGWAPDDVRHLAHMGDADAKLAGPGPWDHMDFVATSPYGEWYLNTVSLVGSPTWLRHQALYPGRDYYSFRSEFESAVLALDADHWAAVASDAGARYVVPLAKHHDGYLLYPSEVPPLGDGRTHSCPRDVIGDVAEAVRARGLHFGAYYSGGLDWSLSGLPIAVHTGLEAAVPRTPQYVEYAEAQWREIVTRYRPQVLWNDPLYPAVDSAERLVQWYYSQVPDGVVNDRFGIGRPDFGTPEYSEGDAGSVRKWEMCRGLGRSFGFNRDETDAMTLSAQQAVRLLVDVVSRGGNLLLGVGPDTSGRVSAVQRRSLEGLGAWLTRNGSAIYGTRPWVRSGDALGDGSHVAWTRRGESLFATISGPADTVALPVPLGASANPRPVDEKARVSIQQRGSSVTIRREDTAVSQCVELSMSGVEQES